jgi:hypothetical protein
LPSFEVCDACAPVFDALRRVFAAHGPPYAIRSDNGLAFARSNGLYDLSKLPFWWLRLGIALGRGRPGHPQASGRYEQMHLTFKKEATSFRLGLRFGSSGIGAVVQASLSDGVSFDAFAFAQDSLPAPGRRQRGQNHREQGRYRSGYERQQKNLAKCSQFGTEMAHPTGFEPVTFGIGIQHSIQLSYGCLPAENRRPMSVS